MKKQLKSLFRKDRVLNLTYRVLTIIFKFLLSIIIVKKLSIHDLGVYGIFQTTVLLLVYLLGIDFYTYNAREILKKTQSISYYIGNQLVLHGFIYLLVLPLSYFLFFYHVIEPQYALYFYAILIVEHISQEIYRVLIVLKKSVVSSLTLLFRSGIWILVLYLLWEFEFTQESIDDIFMLWVIGGVVSIIIGAYHIDFNFKWRVDVDWIKRGIRIAAPFFIATIFYKTVEFSGRFFIDYFWTKEDVGVFTFYSGISNAMFVFVHSTVIIIMSPYLIEGANKGMSQFIQVFEKYRKQILITTLIGFGLAAICIYPLVWYLDNDVLQENIVVFFILLSAVAFFCFSYIPHYGLYAFHRDKQILKASFLGAFFNIVINIILVPKYGVIGAAFTQLISMMILFVSKEIFFKKLKNEG